jgi:hypothetical protein
MIAVRSFTSPTRTRVYPSSDISKWLKSEKSDFSWGEVGERSSQGEGNLAYPVNSVPPHPNPLPKGEREKRTRAAGGVR